MKLVRFIQWFGCDHLKINIGGDAAPQAAQESAVYREMATTFSEIGKRMTDMGMKFGVHAHLNSVFETRQDIDAIMELTDPKHVHFILDTGHVSMAGMDPVKLTRDYTSRIIEYHLKDVAPENKGGYKGSPVGRLQPRAGGNQSAGQLSQQEQNLPASVRYRDRHFFELGRGGVDFPAILQVLNEANWKGWFTLELDSTVTTAKGSATVSKQYIEQILKLAL
jgi:inosose dehydratase